MHRRPRHLARSPHLRVLAWLAWLILAVMPVHAAPGGMAGEAHAVEAVPSTMPMVDHTAHDMSAMTADCCTASAGQGHAAMGDCHCPATCISALPVLTVIELAAVPPAAMPVSRQGAAAPHRIGSPPLRPPLSSISRLI